jgi:hypothetical protein
LTTKEASLKGLPSTLRTKDKGQCLTTMGALHSLLLDMKAFYETVYIPFVSSQLIKEFLCALVRKEAI